MDLPVAVLTSPPLPSPAALEIPAPTTTLPDLLLLIVSFKNKSPNCVVTLTPSLAVTPLVPFRLPTVN